MKLLQIKCLAILFFLIFVDFLNPFSFSLKTDLVYLGILFMAFRVPLEVSLVNALLFGLMKDVLVFLFFPLHTLFFVTTCIVVWYFVKHFHLRFLVKNILIFGILSLYGLSNSLFIGQLDLKLLVLFILQSIVLYHLFHYIISQWIPEYSTG